MTTLRLLGWRRMDIPDAILALNAVHAVVLERARRDAENREPVRGR